jgi:hypothetical protein
VRLADTLSAILGDLPLIKEEKLSNLNILIKGGKTKYMTRKKL